MMADYFSNLDLGVGGGLTTYFVFSLLGYGTYRALKLLKHREKKAQFMGNSLTATTVAEAFGVALMQVQTGTIEFIAQGLPIGLAVVGTIPVVTIGIKAFEQFAK